MFSTFPDGWPGLGLLLLRAAAGGVLVVRCILYLGARHDLRLAVIATLFLTFVSAVFLLLGYRTRVAATVASIASIGSIFFWLSKYPPQAEQTFRGARQHYRGGGDLPRAGLIFSGFALVWPARNHHSQGPPRSVTSRPPGAFRRFKRNDSDLPVPQSFLLPPTWYPLMQLLS